MANIYLVSHGKLERDANSLIFIPAEGPKKKIPIKNITAIYAIGKITLTSQTIDLLLKSKIPVHFFTDFSYLGSLFPYVTKLGKILVKQVEVYKNEEKRKEYAKEIIEGTKANLLFVLKHYKSTKPEIYDRVKRIEIDGKNTKEIMTKEAELWKMAFQSMSEVIKYFDFIRRERRPPTNEINALISFLNALIYSVCENYAFFSNLSPYIGFLHESYEKRASLALDIADIFKPLLSYRIVLYLVNNRIIKKEHFQKDGEKVLLNKKGKIIVIKEFKERLKNTITVSWLQRKISMENIIKHEYKKIEMSLLGIKKYKSFKMH